MEAARVLAPFGDCPAKVCWCFGEDWSWTMQAKEIKFLEFFEKDTKEVEVISCNWVVKGLNSGRHALLIRYLLHFALASTVACKMLKIISHPRGSNINYDWFKINKGQNKNNPGCRMVSNYIEPQFVNNLPNRKQCCSITPSLITHRKWWRSSLVFWRLIICIHFSCA